MESLPPESILRNDLSSEAKQSFQVVALLATILVVGIHYKSDVPDQPDALVATWNQLAQDFVFGGIARVAVPMFAFAAGLFYFRSDDGSLAVYVRKFKQRLRTVFLPYLIISSIALAAWLLVRRIEGRPVELSVNQFLTTLFLHPPAEQLWFLRDLLVLVAVAPLIRLFCNRPILRIGFATTITVAWFANFQIFPIVSGWHLIHNETLLFFSFGCIASAHPEWIERVGRVGPKTVGAAVLVWCLLLAARIGSKADFDIWYVSNHGAVDLILHQSSILVGCLALFMLAWRMRFPVLIRLSGASFFVYLVHEFPLRAIVERVSDQLIDHDISCWLVTPAVVGGCFLAAIVLSRSSPLVFGILTGGRTMQRVLKNSPTSADLGGDKRAGSTRQFTTAERTLTSS